MRKKRHTGEGRQVPFGQHKKKIQEELEQQQNRNRNSEEGLQGDEEENRGSGVGSRSSLLSHPYVVQDRVARRCAFVLCSGSTKTCSRGETKAKTRVVAGAPF